VNIDITVARVTALVRAQEPLIARMPGTDPAQWHYIDAAATTSHALASAVALARCRSTWSQRFTQLDDRVSTLVSDVAASARLYGHVDEMNADVFRALLTRLRQGDSGRAH
jgi:hypothetical protein